MRTESSIAVEKDFVTMGNWKAATFQIAASKKQIFIDIIFISELLLLAVLAAMTQKAVPPQNSGCSNATWRCWKMMGALTWLLGAYPLLGHLADGLWGNGETMMLMKSCCFWWWFLENMLQMFTPKMGGR